MSTLFAFWGLCSVLALVQTNRLNICSSLEQQFEHLLVNGNTNPVYFPAVPPCIVSNVTTLMEKAFKQFSYIQGIKGDTEGAEQIYMYERTLILI